MSVSPGYLAVSRIQKMLVGVGRNAEIFCGNMREGSFLPWEGETSL